MIEPVQEFLRTESASGLALAIAAVVALLWANLAGDSYTALWGQDLELVIGDWTAHTTLQKFAKDGLMAVFFLVVGLEIKRELTVGELADRRLARVPFLAALGGMAVPALLFVAINAGGEGAAGWGIPMATDIAFAVGVLSLLSRRVPTGLAAFLLAIAVIDDIGAILVIAVFYSAGLSVLWLAVAALAVLAFRLMFVWKVRLVVPYVLLAVSTWAALAQSGVSPTLSGVVLGLLVPVRPLADPTAAAREAGEIAQELERADCSHGRALWGWRRMDDLGRQAVPLDERLERLLHPWSAFLVLPLFALAFAGVRVDGAAIEDALSSPVTLGVVVGLVFGKIGGITLGVWVAVRFGLGVLPAGIRWAHVVGVACLCGIGFTVSVFVASLAYADQALIDQARIGILAASVLAGVLGALVLSRVGRRGVGPAPPTIDDPDAAAAVR
ncbi:MAG TPA: Na+/H+ antiporter NhaA [Miltoncostaeaceae bacterium]|nr:Na+/H+ antiporter NhaA [Miltoncostaeaceae bacterium]